MPWSICILHILTILSIFQMLNKAPLKVRPRTTPEHFAPKNKRNLKTPVTHWSLMISGSNENSLTKSSPFLTHHPPDSAPARKMANKENFILSYFQRIGKLHYLLLLSRTTAWISLLQRNFQCKSRFHRISLIYKRIHTFLTFCYVECFFKWWALPKMFLRSLFLPKSSPTSPIVL